jgi:hypothetical protein
MGMMALRVWATWWKMLSASMIGFSANKVIAEDIGKAYRSVFIFLLGRFENKPFLGDLKCLWISQEAELRVIKHWKRERDFLWKLKNYQMCESSESLGPALALVD